MSDSFNAYHVWLGIPLSEQPPNHYRLLGISALESDPDVIDHAADRQMAHIRTFQSGRHGALSQQLLNELASARVCLLSPDKKSEYDGALRAKLAAAPIMAAVPVGKAVPVMPTAQPVAPLAAKPAGAMPPGARPNAAMPPAAKPNGAMPPGARPNTAPATPPPQPKTTRTAPPSGTGAAAGPPRAAGPSGAGGPAGTDEDPFGLRAASGRRPVAAKGDHALFDDVEISKDSKMAVDLNRRPIANDILVQRLAIYAFIGVACFIVLMVGWGAIVRNFGPPSEWLKTPPVAAEPVREAPKHQPAPAPAPAMEDGPEIEDAPVVEEGPAVQDAALQEVPETASAGQ